MGLPTMPLPVALPAAPAMLPNTIVKVQNIPTEATEEDVKGLFEKHCGDVKSIMVIPVPGPPAEVLAAHERGEGGDEEGGEKLGPTKMATVELEDESAVGKALELHGSRFLGNKIM
eukprot:TRINITY_DN25767_c1_g3_i1.p3 TRINITY_DN25767_c1_g3~~TRINITY_DN25767_c1_g3_i1.p3  ORF type:complete len:124 (-),score=8.35 TRINITY_DN25767_c1_g3_i1:59-406(-)